MRIDGQRSPRLNEMVKEVRRLEKEASNLPPVRVLYLANITLDLLHTSLKFKCLTEGLKPEFRFHYKSDVVQDLITPPEGLYEGQCDLVGLCLHLEAFGPLSPDTEHTVFRALDSAISGLRRWTDAPILVHSFGVPVHSAAGIRDFSDGRGEVHRVRRMNARLLDLAERNKGVYLLDMELLQARVGMDNFIDRRFWHMAMAPYALSGVLEMANEVMKVIRAVLGRTRKCLVLDCDNTLWGGILGEVGLQGLQLGGDYPGSAFQEFQNTILKLHNNGVVLCLCSKNNEQDVLEVLDHHPEMVLKRDHFAAMRINWRDKASNLAEMADELRLGLDSFVFVDDSPFETGLVDRLLPQVAVLQLPDDPSRFSSMLLAPGLFDRLEVTDEDLERTRMYSAEAGRRRAFSAKGYGSIEEFCKELGMQVEISDADTLTAPRIAQLSQRSNQFNLTTVRYTESDILNLAARDDAAVICFRLRDRFGDMGIVGVTVLMFAGQECCIESLFMSCRALGRGVEQVLLKDCDIMAEQQGCTRLKGLFRPTEKNQQVTDFYAKNGFSPCPPDDTSALSYTADVGTVKASPAHIEVQCSGRTGQTGHTQSDHGHAAMKRA